MAPSGDDRQVLRRSFRITAVRRPDERGLLRPRRAQAVPVADEELIAALWTRRRELEAALGASVTLEQLRPDASVVAVFAFEGGDPGDLAATMTAAVGTVLRRELGEGVVAAAVPIAEPEDAGGAREPGWDRVAPVLAAIGTGVGVIGFVTFVGGVILWARLNGAGFPPEHGVSVVPASDLLAIGAATLVPQVLWSLGTVVVLWVVGLAGRWVYQKQTGKEATFVALALFLLLLAALAVPLLRVLDELNLDQAWKLGAGALGFPLLVALLSRRGAPFAYVAAATFIAVGVYLTTLEYARASVRDQARAAVVIRGQEATVGFFVAEGAGRVYLARVSLGTKEQKDLDPYKSRLIGIQKDQVSDLAVGSPKPIPEALAQAVALARELCELQPRPAAPPDSAATAAGSEGTAAPVTCWTAPPGYFQPDEPRVRATP